MTFYNSYTKQKANNTVTLINKIVSKAKLQEMCLRK